MSWIQTFSGQKFDLLDPQPDMVHLDDIAHALSLICRFTGHTTRFYSVAQHSLFVSRIVPPRLAFEGLMHDAAEAYVGDVSSPLKSLLPDYKLIEQRIWRVIADKYSIPHILSTAVKHADLVALMTERRDILREGNHLWDAGLEAIVPDAQRVVPISANAAEWGFRRLARSLMEERAVSV